jgi:predicted acyltransferase
MLFEKTDGNDRAVEAEASVIVQNKVARRPKTAQRIKVDIPEELLDKYGRLLSVDFFRGFTMFMLMAEILWGAMGSSYFDGTFIGALHIQLSHSTWQGLHYWDCIQPFFMFIVGVAMPISFGKRWERGATWMDTFKHTGKRSLILLALGVGLYCIHPTGGPPASQGHLRHEFWDVLAQIAFTYFIAFLIMRKSWKFQVSFSVVLLIITALLYRFWPMPGFNHPFVPDHNVGAWLDLQITGYLSHGHWVALNALPTACHTIWGVLAGYVLISRKSSKKKIQILTIAGLICLALGYGLNPVTPIVKRIATVTFTLTAGGWCLLVLVFSFWIIDVKKWQISTARFFAIVGMNSIFIYMFSQVGGARWFANIVNAFTSEISRVGVPVPVVHLITGAIVVAMMYYMLYYLYKKKIFIAI